MELPNIMHPVAKLSTALAAALMLSGCMPGEIRPTIGQQMETGDQRFGDLVFRQLAPKCLAAHFLSRHAGFRASRFQRFDRQGWRPRAGGRYRLDR